jgi:hypothetical protein
MSRIHSYWLAAVLFSFANAGAAAYAQEGGDVGSSSHHWNLEEKERKLEAKATKRLAKLSQRMAKRWKKAQERAARHAAKGG